MDHGEVLQRRVRRSAEIMSGGARGDGMIDKRVRILRRKILLAVNFGDFLVAILLWIEILVLFAFLFPDCNLSFKK